MTTKTKKTKKIKPEVVDAKRLFAELGIITDDIHSAGEQAIKKKELLEKIRLYKTEPYKNSYAVYYNEKYPLYKFISEKKLIELCNKYIYCGADETS